MNKELLDGISVIVCCYNSGWIVARCLDALKKQRLASDFKWEVVLVDNNCTDDTACAAELCMDGSGIDFRIVKEREPGLANARAKGISVVKYKYVVFCDDDNLLCPEYLSRAYSILESDSRIGAVGGKGIPEFDGEPDPRIIPRLEGYAVGSQMGHKNWLFGAGMTLRTMLARDFYTNQKRFLIGRKGSELLSGEDSELAYSIVLRGYRTYPTDDISYVHVLRANRLTWDYCQKMYRGFDLAEGALMVMRHVLDGGKFSGFIKQYIRMHFAYIKYVLFFWHPSASEVRGNCRREIERVNFWGIVRLYSIYREWLLVKRIQASR